MRTAINGPDVQRTRESKAPLQNRVTIRRHSARAMSAGARRGSHEAEWLHGTRYGARLMLRLRGRDPCFHAVERGRGSGPEESGSTM